MTYVDETETSGLGSDERSTPASTLTGQDTLPLVARRTVSTEEVPDLTSTNTNVTRWDIGIGANVLAEFAHKGYAELADLVVRLALWIEVASSLTTTNVH